MYRNRFNKWNRLQVLEMESCLQKSFSRGLYAPEYLSGIGIQLTFGYTYESCMRYSLCFHAFKRHVNSMRKELCSAAAFPARSPFKSGKTGGRKHINGILSRMSCSPNSSSQLSLFFSSPPSSEKHFERNVNKLFVVPPLALKVDPAFEDQKVILRFFPFPIVSLSLSLSLYVNHFTSYALVGNERDNNRSPDG